jgi:predicted RND superfamily exporter protein
VAFVVTGLLRVQVETGVEEFVPRDDPHVHATERVAERFGGDPIVVLLESAEPRALLPTSSTYDVSAWEQDG